MAIGYPELQHQNQHEDSTEDLYFNERFADQRQKLH
jgi:hypothetical protein